MPDHAKPPPGMNPTNPHDTIDIALESESAFQQRQEVERFLRRELTRIGCGDPSLARCEVEPLHLSGSGIRIEIVFEYGTPRGRRFGLAIDERALESTDSVQGLIKGQIRDWLDRAVAPLVPAHWPRVNVDVLETVMQAELVRTGRISVDDALSIQISFAGDGVEARAHVVRLGEHSRLDPPLRLMSRPSLADNETAARLYRGAVRSWLAQQGVDILRNDKDHKAWLRKAERMATQAVQDRLRQQPDLAYTDVQVVLERANEPYLCIRLWFRGVRLPDGIMQIIHELGMSESGRAYVAGSAKELCEIVTWLALHRIEEGLPKLPRLGGARTQPKRYEASSAEVTFESPRADIIPTIQGPFEIESVTTSLEERVALAPAQTAFDRARALQEAMQHQIRHRLTELISHPPINTIETRRRIADLLHEHFSRYAPDGDLGGQIEPPPFRIKDWLGEGNVPRLGNWASMLHETPAHPGDNRYWLQTWNGEHWLLDLVELREGAKITDPDAAGALVGAIPILPEDVVRCVQPGPAEEPGGFWDWLQRMMFRAPPGVDATPYRSVPRSEPQYWAPEEQADAIAAPEPRFIVIDDVVDENVPDPDREAVMRWYRETIGRDREE